MVFETSQIPIPELHNARMALRPARVADLDAVHALGTDADVRRFLFDDRALPRDEAAGLLAANESTFREHGFGVWLAFASDEKRSWE